MKRLTIPNRISALNDAVDSLRMQESESDEPGDKEARMQLADKLDREARSLGIRWVERESVKGALKLLK